MISKGRKYEALLFSIVLFLIVLFIISYLAIKKIEIPRALETVLVIFATAVPSYIGANTIQKKIQSKEGKDE